MPAIDTQDLHRFHMAVTGASGFLGRHLVPTLLDRGARVTLLTRPGGGDVHDDGRLQRLPIDFDDVHGIGRTLQSIGATHLMHLAGYANSDRSIDSIARSLDVNLVAGMRTVLGALDAGPDVRVVIAGSLEAANPWHEPLALGSPYGMSKAMLEVLTGGLHRLYDANVISVRIGMAYGPDDPNSHRLVPSVVQALLADRSPKMGSGLRRCDWIYVSDVVESLIHGALLPRDVGASMDVGSGALTSIRRVAEMIHAEIGKPIAIEFSGALNRPHEQERCSDADAVEAATGWRATVSLADGIARTVAWHRQQPR